jgi:hypothetical protein
LENTNANVLRLNAVGQSENAEYDRIDRRSQLVRLSTIHYILTQDIIWRFLTKGNRSPILPLLLNKLK